MGCTWVGFTIWCSDFSLRQGVPSNVWWFYNIELLDNQFIYIVVNYYYYEFPFLAKLEILNVKFIPSLELIMTVNIL